MIRDSAPGVALISGESRGRRYAINNWTRVVGVGVDAAAGHRPQSATRPRQPSQRDAPLMSADTAPPAPSRPTLHGGAPASAASASTAAAGGASAPSLSVLASINASNVVVPRRAGRFWAVGGVAAALVGAGAWWFVAQPAGGQAEPDWRAAAVNKTPSGVPPTAAVAVPIAGSPASSALQVAAASAPPSAPVVNAARIENSSTAELTAGATAAPPRVAAASAPVERVRAAPNVRAEKPIRTAARKPTVAVAKAKSRTPPPTRIAKAALPPQPDSGSAISPAAFGPKRDTDVDLLEAMVAHDNRASRGAGASAKPATARLSLTQQIARCNESGVPDPVTCVAAVCAGRVGDEGRCAGVARVP